MPSLIHLFRFGWVCKLGKGRKMLSKRFKENVNPLIVASVQRQIMVSLESCAYLVNLGVVNFIHQNVIKKKRKNQGGNLMQKIPISTCK